MPVGHTKDAGWQIGVSRTVPLPIDEVWSRLEDVESWLGEPADDVRSLRHHDRIRIGWQGTTVQVTVHPAVTGTSVRFHQERLPDAEARERQRAHWRSFLERLFADV